jgi:hypothetical protein
MLQTHYAEAWGGGSSDRNVVANASDIFERMLSSGPATSPGERMSVSALMDILLQVQAGADASMNGDRKPSS